MDSPLSRALTLIAITDERGDTHALAERARAAELGGATMIQLRLKRVDARGLSEAARALLAAVTVPVIVNDRADVAMAVGAAGVHVGADDLPVAAVRRIAPPGFIVGASLGSETEVANARDADYAGIGPVYTTPTKPDAGDAIGVSGFARLRALVNIPCVGIGGITADNARAVMHGGAAGVAVIGSVFGADDSEAAARAIRRGLGP
jgi:thiamine-phosphate pyrophosphorylase